jgi:hypothetical protein
LIFASSSALVGFEILCSVLLKAVVTLGKTEFSQHRLLLSVVIFIFLNHTILKTEWEGKVGIDYLCGLLIENKML